MVDDAELGNFIPIPPGQLSSEALQGVIEEFITREGTDYGEVECSLAEKVRQVRELLRTGAARIVFDTRAETCTILSSDELACEELARAEPGGLGHE